MEVVNIQVTEREHKEYQQTQKMLKIIVKEMVLIQTYWMEYII